MFCQRRSTLLFATILVPLGLACAAHAQPTSAPLGPPRPTADAVYRQANAPIQRRVDDLLARMTLDEKAAQMQCVWRGKKDRLLDDNGQFDLDLARREFADGRGLGQVGRPSDAGQGLNARDMAVLTNAIQKFFIEESRLGIPVVFHEECLHGHKAIDATSFPQPIGLAATFDDDLVRRVFALTAHEARCRGAHQALTPVVDVARDPRWGRVEETYGEDPHLVGAMGTAAVQGFQGDATFRDKQRVVATLKHFAGHGQPEAGTNIGPVNVSERVLRETFLSTFKQAIEVGGAMSVMASYNEIDGVPSHANRWLLRKVLRDEWKFDGYVVSDYDAVREMADRPGLFGHHVAKDGREAAALAVRAGVNIELPDPDCYRELIDLVRDGALEEAALDELVRPMLAAKFQLGLFDDPYVDPDYAERFVGSEQNRQLALEAALKTITLLKHDASVAPLDLQRYKTIAVIGPNADRMLQGGYSSVPKHFTTVRQGVEAYVQGRAKVLYHEGCKITEDAPASQHLIAASDPDSDRRMIAEAVEIAKQADVVILAVGGNEHTAREAYRFDRLGDRASLNMVGRQDELVDAIAATGTPMVALVFGGRPLVIDNLCDKAASVFQCWYLGQETGRATAQVLFGDASPGGKLPISFPRSAGHLPVYYNYKPSDRRGYLYDDVSPLFPFGFGLSYTQFEISEPRLKRAKIARGEPAVVEVDVKNIGNRPGDEVVQLYIRDEISSVTRPIKELKGFQRVTLVPGETKTVTFALAPDRLAFWNIDMQYVVEPGDFQIMVGANSADLKSVSLTVE
ncbi:MAG: glycoside hydrolase family 3 C-terminal domain-containing protein [Planctomycetales bacterium]|nr:glycoside hydrolase family 3 C-terminal domain-containing protein [Planctomycetales bacterium]